MWPVGLFRVTAMLALLKTHFFNEGRSRTSARHNTPRYCSPIGLSSASVSLSVRLSAPHQFSTLFFLLFLRNNMKLPKPWLLYFLIKIKHEQQCETPKIYLRCVHDWISHVQVNITH